MTSTKRRYRGLGVAVSACLVLAACGSSDDSRSDGDSGETVANPIAIPDDSRTYTGDTAGPGAVLGDQAGEPNPDPDHVMGTSGDDVITVEPLDAAGDYTNLQWAVDNVASGGTVELGPGAFFLGDGDTEPKHTVVIRRGLTVAGSPPLDGDAEDRWQTVVGGGGAAEGVAPFGSDFESGPFRVSNSEDDNPVVFEDLWLRHWTAEAIYIDAASGFTLRNSRLSDPVNTTSGGTRFVHALFSTGAESQGAFVVEDNLVQLGAYDGDPAQDEQLLGVFFSNHDQVTVTGNSISTMDETIEIIGNGVDSTGRPHDLDAAPADVSVTGNSVDATMTVDGSWPGRYAVLVANNRSDSVTISDNLITARGDGWALGLSGENLEVTDNSVVLEEHDGAFPPGGVWVGWPLVVGFDLGASLVGSEFTNNVFAGSVTDTGVAFIGGENRSSSNVFDLGDSVAALGAPTTLRVAELMADNVFTGDLGTVVDDSEPGANRFD